MGYSVWGDNEGVFLLCSDDFSDLLFDVIMTLKCEEYWLSISILGVYKGSSIIQLLFQREFMLLNQIVFVVLNARKGKDAVLDVVSHLHLVDVDSFLFVLLNVLILDEVIECLFALLMDLY